MPNLMWSWQQATVIAGALAAIWAASRWRGRAPRVRPFLGEGAVVIGLYAFWQLAGALAGSGTYTALERGTWIWRAERSAHLPCECAVQGWVLPHPVLAQTANLYYATMHFPVTIALLVWLFARHRDVYARWRTALALLTAGCLAVQLVPVAPPRMVPSLGMVDTAVRYGQSVYGGTGGFDADQLSAMPSVHIGWAVLVAACLFTVGRSRWRYLGVGHAIATILVVVATGNHYWADGIVAVALLGVVLVVQRSARVWLSARGMRQVAPGREPELVPSAIDGGGEPVLVAPPPAIAAEGRSGSPRR